jgi:MFS family permease
MNRRWWIALLLFAMTAINYIDRVALSLAAKPIAVEFGLTSVQLGYLFSSFLWTYTLALIPMGVLVDRFGAKRVAGLGLALWSAATACTGLAGSLPILLSARLAMGAGEATTNPAGARIVREWFPAAERGTANAIFNSGAFAGPAICAVVVGAMLDTIGWRGSFLFAAGLGVIWLALWAPVYGAPERVRWLNPAEREMIVAQRQMARADVRAQSSAAGLLALLRTRAMWGLVIAQGCSAYCSYLFLSWLPSYLQTAKHLSIAQSGLFTAVPYLVAMILCIAIGRLSDRLLRGGRGGAGGRRFVIALSMLSAAATIAAAPFATSTPLLVGTLCIALTGIAVNTSQLFALLSDLLPDPAGVGKAMGIMVVGGNIFGLLAPILTGYVIALTGNYDRAFVLAGLLMLLGAACCLALARNEIQMGSVPLVRIA